MINELLHEKIFKNRLLFLQLRRGFNTEKIIILQIKSSALVESDFEKSSWHRVVEFEKNGINKTGH